MPKIFLGPTSKNRDQRLRPQNQKECDRQWVPLIQRDKPSVVQEIAVSRAVHCPHVNKAVGEEGLLTPHTNGALRPLIQIKRRKRTLESGGGGAHL